MEKDNEITFSKFDLGHASTMNGGTLIRKEMLRPGPGGYPMLWPTVNVTEAVKLKMKNKKPWFNKHIEMEIIPFVKF